MRTRSPTHSIANLWLESIVQQTRARVDRRRDIAPT
jgi:hypothetical protein